MPTTFEERAVEYHKALPGIVQAALIDHGIASDVIDRRQIGWDGDLITIPVRRRRGEVAFFEKWSAINVGLPMSTGSYVELFPWHSLISSRDRVVLAEGVHEALVLESQGVAAIAATGDGLVFKSREWAELLRGIPRVLLAYRRGDKRQRRSFRLGRHDLVEYVRQSVPHAKVIAWPEEIGKNGGAFEFFVEARRTRGDFEELVAYL